jgi:hypothetical protein
VLAVVEGDRVESVPSKLLAAWSLVGQLLGQLLELLGKLLE